MTLLHAFLEILHAWTPAFPQSRLGQRAVEQAVGALLAMGRRTLSRSLWALGRQHQDWSADYKLHSRAVGKHTIYSIRSSNRLLAFVTTLF